MMAEQNQEQKNLQEVLKLKVKELADYYLDFFYKEQINEEETLQMRWLDKRKNSMIYEANFNFECAISQQKVKFPVLFGFCVNQENNDFQHFDKYFDLTQLITYIMNDEGKIKPIIECPQCKTKQNIPNNKDDKLLLRKIIRPHMFIYNLKKEVGIYPKSIMYNFRNKSFFPTYKGKIQTNYWSLIQPVFQVPLKKEAQFFEIANKLQDYQGSEFINVCLISQVRVNIPVRGNQCVHYESYDLAYLFKHLKEKVETHRMKCVLPYCQSIFNQDDPTTFCIDYDLLKAGMKGLSFSINFTYNPIYHTLTDSLLNRQKDEQIESYRVLEDPQQNSDYLHKIYEFSESIFANEKNKVITAQFYDNYNFTQTQSSEQFFRCQITKLGIQIPARCKMCKKIDFCDVRLFACILYQVKTELDQQNDNQKGVFQKRLNCPLCNFQFQEKPKPPQTFFEQVYIDTDMMKFFIQTPFYQRTQERFQQFLKNRPSQNLDERRQQIRTQIDQLKREKYEWTKGMAMYTFNFQCLLTGNRIIIPVRNSNCQHPDCFDKESLKTLLDKNPDLETYICPLPNCQKPFGSINNLFIDVDLFFIMQRQSAVIKYWKKGAVDLFQKKIIQI